MIEVTEHSAGVILPVYAKPGARKAGFVGEHGGALKLAVAAPPEGGRANIALADLLACLFGLKATQVELVSGATNKSKRFLLRAAKKDQIIARLNELLGS